MFIVYVLFEDITPGGFTMFVYHDVCQLDKEYKMMWHQCVCECVQWNK